MCFVALEAICDLLGPTIMARLINFGVQQNNTTLIYQYGALMLLVTAIGATFAITRSILASSISQKIGVNLRNELFTKIVNFSESSVDELSSGTLITRMTNDTNQVVQFINGLMRIFVKAPVVGIGCIVMASLLNLKLSIIIYLVVVIIALMLFFSLRLSYPRFSKLQLALDKLNAIVQEYLMGIRLIKAFGTYSEEGEKFNSANNHIKNSSIYASMIITFVTPLLNLIIGCAAVTAIYFGAQLFLNNQIKAGDISAFTIYMAQMLGSLLMITNIFNVFVRTQASATRIEEVFNCGTDFKETGTKQQLKGTIEFKNVDFYYPNGSGLLALENLNFKINKGEKLAIIGPTGSGKSTLVWLLLRFYDVNNGEILLDSQNVKKLNIFCLRQAIALAPQKALLFSGTVRENLYWGKPQASDKEIEKVLKVAQADFIYQMPDGLDSYLSSGSVNISGGQKQRISLARALLKDSPILILDDVTSALDAITEAKVRKALLKIENQTLIMITQKCSTAMFADKILVLENGRVQGFGSHRDLLRDCEIYQAIYQSQITNDLAGANL